MLHYSQFPIPLIMNKTRNPRVHLAQNSCLLSRSSRSQLFSWLKRRSRNPCICCTGCGSCYAFRTEKPCNAITPSGVTSMISAAFQRFSKW